MPKIQMLPAFQDNYIFACTFGGSGPFIVDPGDAAPVLQWLQHRGQRPAAILATHHHADHVGGIPALVQHYAVPVYGFGTRIPALDHPLQAGVQPIEDLQVHVLPLPGHTLDHVGYVIGDCLFCGDTLFAAGCGRLFEGSPAQMWQSLERLARLPANTRVYCAHEYTLNNLRFAQAVEPANAAIRDRIAQVEHWRREGRPSLPSRIGLEQATNPFLRVREPAVQAAVRQIDATCDTRDPIATFTVLRRWKDSF